MPEVYLSVLDVGQGSCAVLRDADGVLVFDWPSGPVPAEFLRSLGAPRISGAFISHTHRDHCEGLTADFGDELPIDVIFMNPRRGPKSRLYRQVMRSIDIAKQGPNPPRLVPFHEDVREACMDRGEVQIRLISPPSTAAYSDERRDWDNEHASCGVVRIDHDSGTRIMLPGDVSDRGITAILAAQPEALAADVLVFPHHGGLPGSSDPRRFAERLTAATNPSLVVFSQARDAHGRPRPEIVAGVRAAAPDAHIACTQLSPLCDKRDLHGDAPRPELTLPAAGTLSPQAACCAGTLEIEISTGGPVYVGRRQHQRFVDREVRTPLCVSTNGTTTT